MTNEFQILLVRMLRYRPSREVNIIKENALLNALLSFSSFDSFDAAV